MPGISQSHPLRTQVPEHIHVEVGIKEAQLCVYVFSLAADSMSTGNRLVENVMEATGSVGMFRGMRKETNVQEYKIMSQVFRPDAGIGYKVKRVDLRHGASTTVLERAPQVRTVVSFAQCSCKVAALSARLKLVDQALKSVSSLISSCRQTRIANAARDTF